MQIISNFTSSQDKFLDDRQRWASLAALQANDSVVMPNGFQVFCANEGKWYQLSTSDPKDFTTYTWTEVITGSSTCPIEEELENVTQQDMDALFEDEEEEEQNP